MIRREPRVACDTGRSTATEIPRHSLCPLPACGIVYPNKRQAYAVELQAGDAIAGRGPIPWEVGFYGSLTVVRANMTIAATRSCRCSQSASTTLRTCELSWPSGARVRPLERRCLSVWLGLMSHVLITTQRSEGAVDTAQAVLRGGDALFALLDLLAKISGVVRWADEEDVLMVLQQSVAKSH